jgi:flagellar protein FliO/FliZ
MADVIFYVFVFALLALAVVAGIFIVKSYISGTSPTAAIFGPGPERRLAVVEQAALDSRRRLVLLRRDGVEHLIMTGGPVDVVIETGIGAHRAGAEGVPTTAATVYTRPARPLGSVPERAAE